MSRLDELIQKLCPDGVEYKKIGDLGRIAMCKRILKSQTSSDGDIPFYKIGTFGGSANAFISKELFNDYSEKYSYPRKGNILISAAGTVGRTVIFDGTPSYFQDSNIVWLEHDNTKVIDRYLMYIYETKPWKTSEGGTIARLYNDNILGAVIPVPPLEIQQEIVRILDNFTELTAELNKKLSEELIARRKQYEYYRDELLTFGDDVTLVRLKDVSKLYNGDRGKNYPKQSDLVNEGIPFVNAGDINGTVDYEGCKKISSAKYASMGGAKLKKHDILYCLRGSTGKNGVFMQDEGTVASSLLAIRANESIDYRFLFYLLNSSMELRQRLKSDTGAAQPNLSAESVGNYVFPLPSLKRQLEIVGILNRYDALYSKVSFGLTAEIEDRTKQYEYYRNKLLSFKRKEAS